jgi:twitching motility protein PilT
VFNKKYDLDFAYSVPGLGRFRCNALVQRGARGFVFRVIPMKIPTIDELHLPKVLEKMALEERGLILVTGTTGSGKSTTLASMINHINNHKRVNMVTIEDPIEYLHRDEKSLINQREIGTDTTTYAIALRAALRQDPDVILVGEMRDIETIEIAMTAAETGHLVMSTLHTVDAKETINRIISVFPPHQHHQIRIQLASIIKGIISLRLMPTADGAGRVPAVEVLVTTAMVRDCILDTDKTKLITDVIAQGKSQYGMQTFDQSIFEHYQAGRITYEEALRWATNAEDFKLKVRGVSSAGDVAAERAAGNDKSKSGIKIERFSDK